MSKQQDTSSDARVLVGVVAVFIAIAAVITFTTVPGTPQGFSVIEQTTDDVVWIDITAQNVQQLHSAQLVISYNPSVATFVHAESGPFLSRELQEDEQLFFPEDSVTAQNGRVSELYFVRLSPTGVSGSGVIASLAFTASSSNHGIALHEAILVNEDVEELPSTHASSSLRVIPGTPQEPEPEPEPEPEVRVPLVSDLGPSGTLSRDTTQTTLTARTDISAQCRHTTSRGRSFSQMTPFSSTGATSHQHPVSVTAGNSYTYYVRCQDPIALGTSAEHTISFSVQRMPPGQVDRGGDSGGDDGGDTDRPGNRRGQVRVLGTSFTLGGETAGVGTTDTSGYQLSTAARITNGIWVVIALIFVVSMFAVTSLSTRKGKNPEIVRLRKQEKSKK